MEQPPPTLSSQFLAYLQRWYVLLAIGVLALILAGALKMCCEGYCFKRDLDSLIVNRLFFDGPPSRHRPREQVYCPHHDRPKDIRQMIGFMFFVYLPVAVVMSAMLMLVRAVLALYRLYMQRDMLQGLALLSTHLKPHPQHGEPPRSHPTVPAMAQDDDGDDDDATTAGEEIQGGEGRRHSGATLLCMTTQSDSDGRLATSDGPENEISLRNRRHQRSGHARSEQPLTQSSAPIPNAAESVHLDNSNMQHESQTQPNSDLDSDSGHGARQPLLTHSQTVSSADSSKQT
eukprot:scpid43882/ scgid32650/ 